MPETQSTGNKGAGVVRQLTLEGQILKANGTAAALDAIPEWSERAREAALQLAAKRPITSEDVTDLVGLPREKPRTNHNNAVGAVFSQLASQGLIRRVGYVPARNPQAHSRRIPQWVKTEVPA